MYWIYLLIFILIVFIPMIVTQPFYLLNEDQAEESLIFLLGTLGFLIFMFQERKLLASIREKGWHIKELSRMSKDLSASYSYIGETNRKLDILKEVFLRLIEKSPEISVQEGEKIYRSIKEGIETLAKTGNFAVYFADLKERKILLKREKYTKTTDEMIESYFLSQESKKLVSRRKGYSIICPENDIENFRLWIVFKENNNRSPEDIELIRILAAQILFLFSNLKLNKKTILSA